MAVKFISPSGVIHVVGECSQNLNFLAHAQMIELETGSECGGHGRCGKDRVQFQLNELSQVNAPTVGEKFHLSAEELSGGIRLACQSFPNEDGLDFLVKIL